MNLGADESVRHEGRRLEACGGKLLKLLAVTAILTAGSFAFGQDFATNTYTSSTEDFANPERGFYIQADSYASAPSTVPANLAS